MQLHDLLDLRRLRLVLVSGPLAFLLRKSNPLLVVQQVEVLSEIITLFIGHVEKLRSRLLPQPVKAGVIDRIKLVRRVHDALHDRLTGLLHSVPRIRRNVSREDVILRERLVRPQSLVGELNRILIVARK